MKKSSAYTLITIGVIVTLFILGLISIGLSKGTVKDLRVGNHFRYAFQITYEGENYTAGSVSEQLVVTVHEVNSELRFAKVNVTNSLSGPLTQFVLSQLAPPIPSRSLNQSFYQRGYAIGLSSENFGVQGEYFGWLHSSISIGETVGDWTVIGESVLFLGAGTYATYELVQATYNQTNGVEYITVTHLYYEQLTGVLIHMEYDNLVRAADNHSKIYYHEAELMDLTASSYPFPLLSKVMPFLILMKPVLDMLATYSIFIGLAVVAILIIWFARKQLVTRY